MKVAVAGSGFRQLGDPTKIVVKKESKSMSPSNDPRKVEKSSGWVEYLQFFKQQLINRLDYGLGQPAAAKSGQKQPGLEVSCLDWTDVIC